MNDWIGLGIILLIVVGGFYAIVRANEPRSLTEEEFQRRAHESRGLLGAGLGALQTALDPAKERAEAVQQDFRQGLYDGEQESGDGNDTAPDATENTTPADREERDA